MLIEWISHMKQSWIWQEATYNQWKTTKHRGEADGLTLITFAKVVDTKGITHRMNSGITSGSSKEKKSSQTTDTTFSLVAVEPL